MLLLSEEQPNKLTSRSCGEETFSGSEDECDDLEKLETLVREGEVVIGSSGSSSSSKKKKTAIRFPAPGNRQQSV